MKSMLIAAASLVFLACDVLAADIDKALLLQRHGLQADAKRELIDLIFEKTTSDADKARAYFMLGSIAFDESSVAATVRTWTELTVKFPESPEAAKAKDLLVGLAEILGEKQTDLITDVRASAYLRNAEFWSRGKRDVFQIDSSWIGNVASAIAWYDKVIAEFPGTRAAEVAYQGKMRTLLGWEDPGRYGESHGLKTDDAGARARYMQMLLETFSAFEKAFPKAAAAQAFRFQIAQAYWVTKDWENATRWLKRIIEQGPEDGFYVDLAKRRLEKLKY